MFLTDDATGMHAFPMVMLLVVHFSKIDLLPMMIKSVLSLFNFRKFVAIQNLTSCRHFSRFSSALDSSL